MPRLPRRLRRRRSDWGMGHVEQLLHGYDFFNDAWGNQKFYHPDVPIERREVWPSAETLADMRAAWLKLREEVIAANRLGKPIWAELVFDHGKTIEEARTIRETAERKS